MRGARTGLPRAEHHDPVDGAVLGIGEAAPRVSWTVESDTPGWRQAAYEIEVAGPRGTVTSGRVESDSGVLAPWPDAPLASRERRRVRVRVWATDGDEPTDWSGPLDVEAGLLAPSDWTAKAVAPELPEATPAEGEARPGALLRNAFDVPGEVVNARLYATAHGLYELELNGERIDDHALAPGWTSYEHRLRYRTYDVTAALRPGANVLGARLADGWFRGRIGFLGGNRDLYGDRLALLTQLEVRDADGTVRTYGTGTDGSWRSARGPVLAAGIYEGERYDAREEPAGWAAPGFDDSGWSGVVEVARDPATLVAPDGPPVRCTDEVRPVATLTAPSGATILDLGRNLVGRLRVTVSGAAGDRVRLRHAEVLEDGELCVRPLRGAAATDEYVLRGGGPETWEPRFTFHGFRYAEVTGDVQPSDVVARVLHTDMRRTGTFTCSDPMLVQLHDNVVQSMRGNFVDVPTDCPQRDERLGWTGDLQVFGPTAAYLYDSAGMLRSWLRDVAAEQAPDGTVPFYVPYVPAPEFVPSAAAAAVWGDVAVLTPWTLYQAYGDLDLLREQYPSARAWVDRCATLAGPSHVWDTGFQFGDWLDPTAPPDDPAAARAPAALVATASLAHSAAVLAATAGTLGYEADAARYADLAAVVRDAFRDRWVLPTGLLREEAQTSYALALRFDLLPPEVRGAAAARLAEMVAEAGYRIATGFAGTPVVCDALADHGQLDTAYALLTQTECPSWLYPVTQGATTIWERWDSLLPDGRVNPGEMTSFNHYALGAVADWLHRRVAGLAFDAPGRRLVVAPRPGGGLTSAAASLETPCGPASVAWSSVDGVTTCTVVVPPNASALLDLPGAGGSETVGSGTHVRTW